MWSSEKVCSDSQEFFDLVCESIDSARQSVFVEMYIIFRRDNLGARYLTPSSALLDVVWKSGSWSMVLGHRPGLGNFFVLWANIR